MNESSEVVGNLELLDAVAEKPAGYLVGRLLDEWKAQPRPWQQMSEAEQRQALERLRAAVREAVQAVALNVISERRVWWAGQLDSESANVDKAKLTVVGHNTEQFLDIVEALGRPCVVVVASAEAYMGGLHDARADRDQGELELGEQQAEAIADSSPENEGESATAVNSDASWFKVVHSDQYNCACLKLLVDPKDTPGLEELVWHAGQAGAIIEAPDEPGEEVLCMELREAVGPELWSFEALAKMGWKPQEEASE